MSIVNPLINHDVFIKWFTWPNIIFTLPLPILGISLFIVSYWQLKNLPRENDRACWRPFVITVLLFCLSFFGLAFSYFPYIVPGKLTIWETAAAATSLNFILWGAIVVIPVIFAYSAYSYRVFWGKVKELRYY